jgi:hypothetical protein
MRSRVLLPLPLGPRSTNSSPVAMLSDTLSTTTVDPKRLVRCSASIDIGAWVT